MIIIRIAKLPNINIRNNDDLSQYFISNKHQEQFFEKLSIYKDTDYKPYVNVRTQVKIKKVQKEIMQLHLVKQKNLFFIKGVINILKA